MGERIVKAWAVLNKRGIVCMSDDTMRVMCIAETEAEAKDISGLNGERVVPVEIHIKDGRE